MATIYDVAKAASVSPKTVSRVLNGDAPVGPKTREAVEAAMRQLGYVPSNAARMMRSNRSGLVGLITGALSQKLEPSEPTGLPDLFIVQGVQQVMAERSKTLMIADTGGVAERTGDLIRTFLQHRVEALIYVADYHQNVQFDFGAAGCPLMLVNCFDDKGTPAIVPDDAAGQLDLVRELIRVGHRRIAFLTLDPGIVATPLRSKGYRHALEEAGIGYDPALKRVGRRDVADASEDLLCASMEALLALKEPPSVICCGNDEMALRLYGLLRSRGLRVPEDISVAGFDNYRNIAETLYPALTTAELPYRAMGRLAAERTLEMIEGRAQPQGKPERVAGPVHWRDSVEPLNSITKLRSSKGG